MAQRPPTACAPCSNCPEFTCLLFLEHTLVTSQNLMCNMPVSFLGHKLSQPHMEVLLSHATLLVGLVYIENRLCQSQFTHIIHRHLNLFMFLKHLEMIDASVSASTSLSPTPIHMHTDTHWLIRISVNTFTFVNKHRS